MMNYIFFAYSPFQEHASNLRNGSEAQCTASSDGIRDGLKSGWMWGRLCVSCEDAEDLAASNISADSSYSIYQLYSFDWRHYVDICPKMIFIFGQYVNEYARDTALTLEKWIDMTITSIQQTTNYGVVQLLQYFYFNWLNMVLVSSIVIGKMLMERDHHQKWTRLKLSLFLYSLLRVMMMALDLLKLFSPALFDLAVPLFSVCNTEMLMSLFPCLPYIIIFGGITSFLLVTVTVRKLKRKLDLDIPYESISKYSIYAPTAASETSSDIKNHVPSDIQQSPLVLKTPAVTSRPKTQRRDLELTLAESISGKREGKRITADQYAPFPDHKVIWNGPYPNSKYVPSQTSDGSREAWHWFRRCVKVALEVALVTYVGFPWFPLTLSTFYPRWRLSLMSPRKIRKARIPLQSSFSDVDVPDHIDRSPAASLSSPCSMVNTSARDINNASVHTMTVPLIDKDMIKGPKWEFWKAVKQDAPTVYLDSCLQMETETNLDNFLD